MNGLVLSVFPGIDVLGMGFEAEGFCVVRGPDVLWGGDIRAFHPPAGVFDGVIGGPPCQPFSQLVNLMKAKGIKPRHPNLIPEFERVVAETSPRFFVMEEVPRAPVPHIPGYTTHSFTLCPTWLGEEQRRRRKISFGLRGPVEIDLRQFIEYVALELSETESAVLQAGPDNSDEAKGLGPGARVKTAAVLADRRDVPVAHGGTTGKRKRTKTPPVGQHSTFAYYENGKVKRISVLGGHGPLAYKSGPVTGSDGGVAVRMHRYRYIEEMCRLQGLPGDFFGADSPFRMEAKRQLIGNAVPLPMARAIAKAVCKAIEETR